jgi:hypothetical protein
MALRHGVKPIVSRQQGYGSSGLPGRKSMRRYVHVVAVRIGTA